MNDAADHAAWWALMLVCVSGLILCAGLAYGNALARTEWPAACEGITTAAECAAALEARI